MDQGLRNRILDYNRRRKQTEVDRNAYKARMELAEAALDKLRAAAESSTVLKALLEKFDIL